jgi:hypothetical protein
MIDALGWVATALFALSYFFKAPIALRRIQAAAAALWILYGAAIHALPVVASNGIVAGLALWSSFRPAPRAAAAPKIEAAVGDD